MKAIVPLLIALPVLVACKNNERAETLTWMDNTYNPHSNVSEAYGHGHTGWYVKSGDHDETLTDGSTETFTYDGCQMTLNFKDDRNAAAHHEIYSTGSLSFNLRDIDPQSIKLSTFSHFGGFRCEAMNPEQRKGVVCDHGEIVFLTHGGSPLIDGKTDTIYANRQGSERENKNTSEGAEGHFEVDDVQYATRFMKAFRHVVELCGGES